MLDQPGLDVLLFVGGVVVQNHMNRKTFGYFPVHRAHELQELLVAVLVHAGTDDSPIDCVQSSEKCRGAVPLVVAGGCAGSAPGHRQRSLGVVQGLDGGLLVHAQHHRLLGRVQVEPDDVDELLLKGWVVRELERLDQVRLEATPGPDPLNCGWTDPDLFGHRATAPMRCPGRLFELGQANDLLDLFRRYAGLTAATFADHLESGQPLLGEPRPPRPHGHRSNPNGRGDLGVGHTIGGHQQHLGSLHLPMRCGRRPSQYFQCLALTGGHDQRGCCLVHANNLANLGYLFWRHTTSTTPGAGRRRRGVWTWRSRFQVSSWGCRRWRPTTSRNSAPSTRARGWRFTRAAAALPWRCAPRSWGWPSTTSAQSLRSPARELTTSRRWSCPAGWGTSRTAST